jgi:3-methyladenine DNA glycosylase AlkC
MAMGDEPFLVKNFFDPTTVGVLADGAAAEYPPFDRAGFLAGVFDAQWQDREFKERLRHVTVTLAAHLPAPYPAAVAILRSANHHFAAAGLAALVCSDFVEAFGIDDYDTSIPALGEFTTVMSAEFAVRPFILRYPDRMYPQLLEWAHSPDPAVRRLASEGSRPRLPWAMALPPLKADPSPVLPILAALRHDPSEDVRRSVANHLNDIAKDHPNVVITVLTEWQDGSPEVDGITRHGLRTLLKRGDTDALALLGYRSDPDVRVHDLHLDPADVAIGGSTRLHFAISSTGHKPQRLMVDLVVHFQKAKGQLLPKVFKLKTAELAPAETIELSRKLAFTHLSTRTIYPGPHAVEVQVNGSRLGRLDFDVAPA